MSLLDDRTAPVFDEEVQWVEPMADAPAEPSRSLCCTWVADPAHPEHMICAWGPRPAA